MAWALATALCTEGTASLRGTACTGHGAGSTACAWEACLQKDQTAGAQLPVFPQLWHFLLVFGVAGCSECCVWTVYLCGVDNSVLSAIITHL